MAVPQISTPKAPQTHELPKTKTCCTCLAGVNFDLLAMVMAYLTVGNGVLSLITGIEYFSSGGTFIPNEDVANMAAGGMVLFVGSLMLIGMYSRLKVGSQLAQLTKPELADDGSRTR